MGLTRDGCYVDHEAEAPLCTQCGWKQNVSKNFQIRGALLIMEKSTTKSVTWSTRLCKSIMLETWGEVYNHALFRTDRVSRIQVEVENKIFKELSLGQYDQEGQMIEEPHHLELEYLLKGVKQTKQVRASWNTETHLCTRCRQPHSVRTEDQLIIIADPAFEVILATAEWDNGCVLMMTAEGITFREIHEVAMRWIQPVFVNPTVLFSSATELCFRSCLNYTTEVCSITLSFREKGINAAGTVLMNMHMDSELMEKCTVVASYLEINDNEAERALPTLVQASDLEALTEKTTFMDKTEVSIIKGRVVEKTKLAYYTREWTSAEKKITWSISKKISRHFQFLKNIWIRNPRFLVHPLMKKSTNKMALTLAAWHNQGTYKVNASQWYSADPLPEMCEVFTHLGTTARAGWEQRKPEEYVCLYD